MLAAMLNFSFGFLKPNSDFYACTAGSSMTEPTFFCVSPFRSCIMWVLFVSMMTHQSYRLSVLSVSVFFCLDKFLIWNYMSFRFIILHIHVAVGVLLHFSTWSAVAGLPFPLPPSLPPPSLSVLHFSFHSLYFLALEFLFSSSYHLHFFVQVFTLFIHSWFSWARSHLWI